MVRVRVLSVGLAVACATEAGAGATDTDSDTEQSAGTQDVDDEDTDNEADAETTPQTTDNETSTTGDEEDESSSGAEGETSSDTEDTSNDCVIGSTLGSEVVTIGDSYLAVSTVVQNVEIAARLNGSLGPQDNYRRYDVAGTQMATGVIPGQFTSAVADDPAIKAVIMTGGGNDVLAGVASGCLSNPPPAQSCTDSLEPVFSTATALLADMATAGVSDVIYFFYPHLPPGFPPGAKNETLDYAAPIVQELCENAPGINCHFVDIRDAFEGHPEYIGPDAIHPTFAGSEAIAELVWQAMLDNCVAQ